MDGAPAETYTGVIRAHLATLLACSGAADAGCCLPQRPGVLLRASPCSEVPTGLPPQPGTAHPGFHTPNLCTLHTPTYHLYVAGSATGTLLPSACGRLCTFPGLLDPVRCLLFSVRCPAVSSTLLVFCPLGSLLFYILLAWHHEIYDTIIDFYCYDFRTRHIKMGLSAALFVCL
jgi:hypothetical protein